MLKEGHGRCNFFEWYTGPPLNFERKNDCEGENKRPQSNLHVEGPKSPLIVDWGNIKERTRFRSDEMVAPVVIAARREQGAESVGSGFSPLNWQTADQDTTSDETLVPASPPLSTRRKLDFDEAISGLTPNVCRASPLSDSAAFEPSPSFKDGFVETVVPASVPQPPGEPREFRHSMRGLGSSTTDMPSPHVSVDID
ncbi:uncharacterized protein M6B38_289645 [Iris pallida]|uniref:Uncharacterized protein n=1 Tax=Iris pallida TaxID=29817 RepID=A0AAX6HW71_IRIPA|nr:uncharacterized protein M6B38_289645 [Iris pallida]